jgi:hypothetical protein
MGALQVVGLALVGIILIGIGVGLLYGLKVGIAIVCIAWGILALGIAVANLIWR